MLDAPPLYREERDIDLSFVVFLLLLLFKAIDFQADTHATDLAFLQFNPPSSIANMLR